MKVELMSYCKPGDLKWLVYSQKWDSGSQWCITLKEILCGLSWYQKLNFLNLGLAPGFARERHICWFLEFKKFLQQYSPVTKLPKSVWSFFSCGYLYLHLSVAQVKLKEAEQTATLTHGGQWPTGGRTTKMMVMMMVMMMVVVVEVVGVEVVCWVWHI